MYDMNEVTTLFFDLIGFVAMLYFLRNRTIVGYPFLIASYCFILLSNTFTVLEGVWLYHIFNLLEHLMYLAAGICVLAAAAYHSPVGGPWKTPSQ
jgi:hypothetical protein